MKKLCVIVFLIHVQHYLLSGTWAACPEIVSRSGWGGRNPIEINYMTIPVNNVIIHQTETPECTTKDTCSSRVRSIQKYHMEEQDFDDVGYNFLIGGDGKVYEGAGWHKKGAHTKGYNNKALGIAFIGTFHDELPYRRQLNAAKDLLKCGVELGEIAEDYKLFGGRQVRPTDSPGLKLFREIKKWDHYTSSPP